VILHSTLGGCASIAEAFAAAHSVLEPGGIVALAGVNRIRGLVARNSDATVPRASPWGYRRAARQAGFAQVELYVVQPDIENPAYAISMAPASARAFFHHELMARKTSGRNRLPIVRAVLAQLNLAPYLQPFLVVVGTK
jgi:predicted methyltransferase